LRLLLLLYVVSCPYCISPLTHNITFTKFIVDRFSGQGQSPILSKEFFDSFSLTREEFSKLLEKREELGRFAEFRILDYER